MVVTVVKTDSISILIITFACNLTPKVVTLFDQLVLVVVYCVFNLLLSVCLGDTLIQQSVSLLNVKIQNCFFNILVFISC